MNLIRLRLHHDLDLGYTSPCLKSAYLTMLMDTDIQGLTHTAQLKCISAL